MNLAEQIVQHLSELPQEKQREVLDFIEYLAMKSRRAENTDQLLGPGLSALGRSGIGDYSSIPITEKHLKGQHEQAG